MGFLTGNHINRKFRDFGGGITRTVFEFGHLVTGPYGYLVLHENGRIGIHARKEEVFYKFENGHLIFTSYSGRQTARFRPYGNHPLHFRAIDGPARYLKPIVNLPAAKASASLPAVFINTLPKAGTYLALEALKSRGFNDLRLHLSSSFFDDNRLVADELIHWAPQERRTSAPAHALTSLLKAGEVAVGHIDEETELRKIAAQPLMLINLIRHPFSQAYSMYQFRLRKVRPKKGDHIWRHQPATRRFKAYLDFCQHPQWLDQNMMTSATFPYLRYEDIRRNLVDRASLDGDMASLLEAGLRQVIGKKSATYIPDSQKFFTQEMQKPEIQAFFARSGATAYARTIWPDNASL